MIWGEHGGIIKKFCDIHDQVHHFSEYCEHERKAYFDNNEDPNQWIANLNPTTNYVEQAIITSIQSFFSTLYSQYKESHDIIGFKEVRYGKLELELLRMCYPETTILLLVRKPIETWKSIPDDWNQDVKKFTDKWNQNAEYYFHMNETDKNAYLIRYEDLVDKDEQTLNLLSNLAQVSKKSINNVLAHKLFSTMNKKISQENKSFILQNCKQKMNLLNY